MNAPRVKAADGPRHGTAGVGHTHSLLAIGDSIIAGVGAARLESALVGQVAHRLADALDCRIDWAAAGKIGFDSGDILAQLLPGLPAAAADFVVLSVGVNDVTSLSRLGTWRRNLGQILTDLRRHSPQALIAVAGMPPLKGFPLLPQPLRMLFGFRGRTFDAVCRQVVGQHAGVIHVPLEFEPREDGFSADGFHPSEQSYTEFAGLVVQAITRKRSEIGPVIA